MNRDQLFRYAQIAAPFVLILAGGIAYYVSPWPAILHSFLGGAHIRLIYRWSTVGLPLLAIACWTAAIWLSLRLKRRD